MSTTMNIFFRTVLLALTLLPAVTMGQEKSSKKQEDGKHSREYSKCERYMCRKEHILPVKVDSSSKDSTIIYEKQKGINCHWRERDGWCGTTGRGKCRSISRKYEYYDNKLLFVTIEKYWNNHLYEKTKTIEYDHSHAGGGRKTVKVEREYYRGRQVPR